VLGHLDTALDLYTALDGKYDPADLEGVLTDIREAISTLPQRHAECGMSSRRCNKHDPDAMERHLGLTIDAREVLSALAISIRPHPEARTFQRAFHQRPRTSVSSATGTISSTSCACARRRPAATRRR
jgi:hypothetical protein